jgi:hypothetical protein
MLGVAIVAAILAGAGPARSVGCARCSASPPEPTVARAPSAQSGGLRPRRQDFAPAWRELRREARSPQARRWTGERTAAGGGTYFVCVRVCDGGFFPVPYVSDRDSLAKICQALCPNAEARLYSMPFGGTIEDAVSTSGESYADLPDAGTFEQTRDPNCSCRRKEQGWAEVLAAAEARAQRHSGDILVTPEMSERMSRPVVVPEASAAADYASDPEALALIEMAQPPAVLLDADGVDMDLSAAAAALSHETSGIDAGKVGAAHYGLNQGQIVEEEGPDGSVKRVRVVAPELY